MISRPFTLVSGGDGKGGDSEGNSVEDGRESGSQGERVRLSGRSRVEGRGKVSPACSRHRREKPPPDNQRMYTLPSEFSPSFPERTYRRRRVVAVVGWLVVHAVHWRRGLGGRKRRRVCHEEETRGGEKGN